MNPFTSHPATVGESYGEHLATATGFGSRMILAGIACMLHGIFPFLFVTTGSTHRAPPPRHDDHPPLAPARRAGTDRPGRLYLSFCHGCAAG